MRKWQTEKIDINIQITFFFRLVSNRKKTSENKNFYAELMSIF